MIKQKILNNIRQAWIKVMLLKSQKSLHLSVSLKICSNTTFFLNKNLYPSLFRALFVKNVVLIQASNSLINLVNFMVCRAKITQKNA